MQKIEPIKKKFEFPKEIWAVSIKSQHELKKLVFLSEMPNSSTYAAYVEEFTQEVERVHESYLSSRSFFKSKKDALALLLTITNTYKAELERQINSIE